jgi:hypothetical protein
MTEHTPRLLDHTVPQKTTYAVPLWLRNEQIKHALKRVKGRIQPHPERSESVAIVGFGPSLADTWEQVKDFPFIITCSGSHKFLIERGIIPTWHCEVDPRAHKIALLGEPHPSVIYFPSSTSHPAYLEHLATGLGEETFEKNVQLWHVFDNSDEGARILPRGEWCITGGCDVGLRAMGIAAFLGFRDLHIFGMDGSAREKRHAADHPHGGTKYDLCLYDGVEYKTTPGMLEAARQIWHELDEMPAVKTTFYGEGLIQAMAKNYERKPSRLKRPLDNVVGIARPELISADYARLNQQLHEENLAYGVGGGKHADTVLKICKAIETTSVLDYGAGKCYLAKALPFPIWNYDPAIQQYSESPRPADIVVCTDVLEHIEPDKLAYVLDDLRRCVVKVGYFVISTRLAGKTLPDGRNTHLIVKGRAWWKAILRKFFTIGKITERGSELHVVVGPLRQAVPSAAKASVATVAA